MQSAMYIDTIQESASTRVYKNLERWIVSASRLVFRLKYKDNQSLE